MLSKEGPLRGKRNRMRNLLTIEENTAHYRHQSMYSITNELASLQLTGGTFRMPFLAGYGHIICLQSLISFADFKFHSLAIMQDAVSFSSYRAKMNEYIIAAIARNEAKSFIGIEPFYAARFSSRIIVIGVEIVIRSG